MICRDIAMDFLRSIKPLFLVLFTNRIQKLRETRSQLEKEVKQVIREFGDDNRTSEQEHSSRWWVTAAELGKEI
jgi:hypothetical protein